MCCSPKISLNYIVHLPLHVQLYLLDVRSWRGLLCKMNKGATRVTRPMSFSAVKLSAC